MTEINKINSNNIEDINDLNIYDLFELFNSNLKTIFIIFVTTFLFSLFFLDLNDKNKSIVSAVIKSYEKNVEYEYRISEIDIDRYKKPIINLKLVNNKIFSIDELYRRLEIHESNKYIKIDPNLKTFIEILFSDGNFREFSILENDYRGINKLLKFVDKEERTDNINQEQIIFINNVSDDDREYLAEFLSKYLDFTLNAYSQRLVKTAKEKQNSFLNYNRSMIKGFDKIIESQIVATQAIALGYLDRVKNLRDMCLKFINNCELKDSEINFNLVDEYNTLENLNTENVIEIIDELIVFYESFLSENYLNEKYDFIFGPILNRNFENNEALLGATQFIKSFDINEFIELGTNAENEYTNLTLTDLNETKRGNLNNILISVSIAIFVCLLFFLFRIVSEGYNYYKRIKQ